MDVSNLPKWDRIRLFNKWVRGLKHKKGEFDFGNEINLTRSQLSDPNYIIPEWGCEIPEWMINEKLSEKIGMKCSTGTLMGNYKDSGIRGTFLGIQATYEDFYYIINSDIGDIIYDTCVNRIRFYTEEEYKNEFL